MMVNLRHAQSGARRQCKVGFSWTTLFFGFFPALFRGDAKWATIMFVVALVTFGLSGVVFAFVYNKIHIKGLLEGGYAPADETSRAELVRRGIMVPLGRVPTGQAAT